MTKCCDLKFLWVFVLYPYASDQAKVRITHKTFAKEMQSPEVSRKRKKTKIKIKHCKLASPQKYFIHLDEK